MLQKNRKPTLKQQRAVENLVANGGNVSTAMRQAGYSEAMARNPQKLTESDYVKQLFAEVGLTDTDAFTQLKEGLAASKTVVMGSAEDSFVDIQPDHAVRHKYLETMLRVRGLGAAKQEGGNNFNFINIAGSDSGNYKL